MGELLDAAYGQHAVADSQDSGTLATIPGAGRHARVPSSKLRLAAGHMAFVGKNKHGARNLSFSGFPVEDSLQDLLVCGGLYQATSAHQVCKRIDTIWNRLLPFH